MSDKPLNLNDLTTIISNPNTSPEMRNQVIKLKEQLITTIKAEAKVKLQEMIQLREARIQAILNSQVENAARKVQLAEMNALVERVRRPLEEDFVSKGLGGWKELLE